MAISRNRRIQDMEDREEYLRQRAAWAQGEERKELLAELECLSVELAAVKGVRR